MFKNPFSFKGRSRRLEYGLSYIIYLTVRALIGGEVNMLGTLASGTDTVFSLVLYIPSLLVFCYLKGRSAAAIGGILEYGRSFFFMIVS